jgi:hypothetical protein
MHSTNVFAHVDWNQLREKPSFPLEEMRYLDNGLGAIYIRFSRNWLSDDRDKKTDLFLLPREHLLTSTLPTPGHRGKLTVQLLPKRFPY